MTTNGKPPSPDSDEVMRQTRRWIEAAVIGLNLCPFAAPVYQRQLLDLVICESACVASIADALAEQLERLRCVPADQLESVLLILPQGLRQFDDFNDFLDVADGLIRQLALSGEIQIASFHPAYRFAGKPAQDPTNNTNRSPYPTLHLLREQSVTRVITAGADTEAIVRRNLQTMTQLGNAGWRRLSMRKPQG